MKKCNDCNVEMIEDTDIHTDYVGGVSFDEQIYLTYVKGTKMSKNIFGQEIEKEKRVIEKVKARVCPNCGKVELFVELNK